MTKFIKILDSRIILTSIKRYTPLRSDTIVLYYTSSRQKVENEAFLFETEKERDSMLDILDSLFL